MVNGILIPMVYVPTLQPIKKSTIVYVFVKRVVYIYLHVSVQTITVHPFYF